MIQKVNFVSSILLWYLFSSYFNVYNKLVLINFPFPWFLATVQCVVGICLVAPMHLKASQFSILSLNQLGIVCWRIRYIAIVSCISNVSGTMAVGSGSIALAQTIKAAEPIFTTIVYVYVTNKSVSLYQILSFLVIVVGALVASRFEVGFAWSSVIAGTVSNMCAGVRSVLSKNAMVQSSSEELLNPRSFYLLLTVSSLFFLLPATLLFEGSQIVGKIQSLRTDHSSAQDIVTNIIVSGALFHMYNEFSFQALNVLRSPISYAIANSFRRVAIIVLSVVILGAPWTYYGMLGSLISVAGVFLYSICK